MPKPISPAEASAPRIVIVTMDHEMRDPMGHMNPTALTRNADGLIEAQGSRYRSPSADVLKAPRCAGDELENRIEGISEGVAA